MPFPGFRCSIFSEFPSHFGEGRTRFRSRVEHRVQRLGLRQGQGRVARIPRGNRQTLSVMTFFYLKARSVGLCKMHYDRELSNWPSLYCTKFGSTLLRFTQQITQILIEP